FKFNLYTIVSIVERCFGRIAYTRTIPKNNQKPEYQEKPIDQIICGHIFAIRCFKFTEPNGNFIFFHNQPEILLSNKSGEIQKIKNVSDPIRVFEPNAEKPIWRAPKNKVEEDKLRSFA